MREEKESDLWETPESLFHELDLEFGFEIDLCASYHNSKCDIFSDDLFSCNLWIKRDYYGEFSGLSGDWQWSDYRAAFMNPPYSNPLPFVQEAYYLSESIPVVCLIKCDTSTKTWAVFWDYINNKPKPGIEVRFLPKRLKFERNGVPSKNCANFPSVIVVMDRRNVNK